jgi:uncharacterized protein (DUF1015 family)
MPRFLPFPGLRYDPSLSLDQMIAPPYDVVGAEQREKLANRHVANAIHLELPADEPADHLDRYRVAALLLARWQEEGILRHEEHPAFYPYRMTPPAGRPTTGVLGILGCEPPDGSVLPHEETIPKDRSDRLELLRATRANLSPIWGLSLTSGLAATYRPEGSPVASALDDDGVLHELWLQQDPEAIAAITAGVAASPVVLADGHHRWATAVTYQQERAEAGEAPGGQDFVLALVVELADEQLTVGPVHRSITLPEGTNLASFVAPWYTTHRVVETRDPDALRKTAEEQATAGQLTLVTCTGVWHLSPTPRAAEIPGSELDSVVFAEAVAASPGVTSVHHHDVPAALGPALDDEAGASFLLRPATVEQIGRWAAARRCMPPKTTYFVPKPRTGMVFRLLDNS